MAQMAILLFVEFAFAYAIYHIGRLNGKIEGYEETRNRMKDKFYEMNLPPNSKTIMKSLGLIREKN